MKILVTGGAGFIASHIVDAYIAQGNQVAIIDNLSTGHRENINAEATFYEADIRDRERINEIISKEKPDIINHHAAIAEVVKSLRDPNPTLDVNVLGTANILVAAGEANAKKIIFSSTGGAIYGEPDTIPANENAHEAPLSPYGLSKLLGEEIIQFYSRMYGFSYINFRYPNVYGPRQNPKGEAGVVAIFYGLMKANQQPTIFGDGAKTRDYVYVDDIVCANLLALEKGKDITINLGSGIETSDKLVFEKIANVLHYSGEPTHTPHREGEVRRISLTGTKAKEVLGWEPTLTFGEGIARYHKAMSEGR